MKQTLERFLLKAVSYDSILYEMVDRRYIGKLEALMVMDGEGELVGESCANPRHEREYEDRPT